MGVLIALVFSRNTVREKAFLPRVALRGAAPIVLATFALIAGIEKAHFIFHLVCFVVFISPPVQGTTVSWLARRLQLVD